MTRKKKLPHLWITDPWTTLDHAQDTSLRFIQEAQRMEVQQYWCDVKTIHLDTHQVQFTAQEILGNLTDLREKGDLSSLKLGTPETKSPKDFASIHYRTDPPVDLAYLHTLHLLHLGLRGVKTCQVVNSLEVLLSLNEKMEAAALPTLMPPSLVGSPWELLQAFGKKQGRTVLKPLHEAQSHGVELLDWRTTEGILDAKIKLKLITQQFQTPVILQAYLEGISEGETRLWFIDGKLLAYVKKLPIRGDFRVDIDRGSQLTQTTLSKADRKSALMISKHLKNRKIRLAAVDLIDGYITDFNFTSPGLIPLMEATLSENLAKPIVRALFG